MADDIREWMQDRFDRLDDRLASETAALSKDIVDTRHQLKPVIQQIALQVAENVSETKAGARRLDAIDVWRSEGGPLDQRFHRHSERIEKGESWRDQIKGGLIAVSVLVPIATGIVTALVVAVVLHYAHLSASVI